MVALLDTPASSLDIQDMISDTVNDRIALPGMGFCRGFLLVGMVFGVLGCSPPTEQEQEYFERRDEEQENLEGVTQALKGSTRQTEAMNMVKEQDAPDANGTIEDWIDRKVHKSGEKIMFPRWKVLPRGGDKFEVRYEYSEMEESYSIKKRGYAWTVDLVLKIVSPHRELSESELGGSRSKGGAQISQQQRRERQRVEEFSLE